MISNVSPSTLSYEDTFNTLQYANRAKNIKTKVRANEINVVSHVTEYKEIIADLRKEVEEWKSKCSQFESQLEEEGRQRQLEMDENIGMSPNMIRSRPNAQSSSMNASQLPLLSRTVSMGLQTPRNSKVEKKVNTWASEIADLSLDRRNVQTHLEEVNAKIAELSESKVRLQEAMFLKKDFDGVPLSAAVSDDADQISVHVDEVDGVTCESSLMTPMKRGGSKRNLESICLAKREYDLVARKLEENLAERVILLQRLGRNAESCKRIQREMSQITPRAEDASLFHQVKLELVINVLEIGNFNRAMQEAQLAHALALANDKYSRTLELADYLRTTLSDFGYEESMEVMCKFDLVHAPTDEPLECADLPSPFAQSLASAGLNSSRSPMASYASPSNGGAMFGAGEEPSTPSRFDLGSADVSAHIQTSRTNTNGSRSGMSSVRFQGIAESASESSAAVSSPMASRRPPTRVPFAAASTATTGSKVSTTAQANAANRPGAAKIGSKAVPARTTYTVVAPVRSNVAVSAKKSTATTSVTARPRQSMIPTAPASVTKERIVRSNTPTGSTVATASSGIGGAKRTSALVGGAQRVSTVNHFSRAGGASARPVSSSNASDLKKAPADRYKNDPAVMKALASFRPAFEPQERSTPPSSSVSSASASRHVKVNSAGAVIRSSSSDAAPSTPTTPRAHSNQQGSPVYANQDVSHESAPVQFQGGAIGVFRVEPNPLAVLLQNHASSSSSSSLTSFGSYSSAASSNTPSTPVGAYSRPPTVGMVYSPSSPSQNISTSPLFSATSGNLVHTHTRSSSGPSSPMSPIAKPLRV